MDNPEDFWSRPVTDSVAIELVPGNRPRLHICYNGQRQIELELMEARELIEVLTVAAGELFILKNDPGALAKMQRLLKEDVTLVESERRLASRITGYVHGRELIRRYNKGQREFHKVDLRLADLRGAHLPGADLRDGDLAGAILKRANLFQANLENANLSRANLEEAGLFQANLTGTDLSHANLRKAYLVQANLKEAIVTRQQLGQASVLLGATLPDGTRQG